VCGNEDGYQVLDRRLVGLAERGPIPSPLRHRVKQLLDQGHGTSAHTSAGHGSSQSAVSTRDVQNSAGHADSRMTSYYDRNKTSLARNATHAPQRRAA